MRSAACRADVGPDNGEGRQRLDQIGGLTMAIKDIEAVQHHSRGAQGQSMASGYCGQCRLGAETVGERNEEIWGLVGNSLPSE